MTDMKTFTDSLGVQIRQETNMRIWILYGQFSGPAYFWSSENHQNEEILPRWITLA